MSNRIGRFRFVRASIDALTTADLSAWSVECNSLERVKLLGPLIFAFIACFVPIDIVVEAFCGGFIICLLMLIPSVKRSSGSQKQCSFDEEVSQKRSLRRNEKDDTFKAFKRDNVTFSSSNLEGQVAELLCRIDIDVVTAEKFRVLKNSISTIFLQSFSKVDVQVIAASNPDSVRAFGTAIPEVAVLLTVPPDELCKTPPLPGKDRSRVLACLRTCISILMKQGFRFRRSDFSADTPKVIFVADAYQFSIDLYINSVAPLKLHSLLVHVAEQDPLAKDLVLLVRHWARERGLALVAAGYISLSAWMVLALFYVQVAAQSNKNGSRLATLGNYLKGAPEVATEEAMASGWEVKRETSCAALLRGFMSFYARDFDWCTEIVSLRFGSRQTCASPTSQWTHIEDPFDTSKNLAASLTASTLGRLREELERAHQLLEQGGSLGGIVEAWRKPEEL